MIQHLRLTKFLIYDGQQSLQFRPPQTGETVRWIGQRTGRIERYKIVDTGVAIAGVDESGKYYGLVNLIRLSPVDNSPRCDSGDSGAALVSECDGKIVGLVSKTPENASFDLSSKIPPNRDELGEFVIFQTRRNGRTVQPGKR